TAHHRIRQVAAGTGIITTVAGTGAMGFSGDGGPATSAQLHSPTGVAIDAAGNLFIADASNHRIRRVAAGTGIITTVAGTGAMGFSGDNGLATSAPLNSPIGVAVDAAGDLFIADAYNHRIRRVAVSTGIITTAAGTGESGFSGDGGPATSAQVDTPAGVAVDAAGNLLIADTNNQRVRRAAAGTGLITTIAGTGIPGFSDDGSPATRSHLSNPTGIAMDVAGNLFIADTESHRIRRVAVGTARITTIAGTGIPGFSGDGGPATDAVLWTPTGGAVDAVGNLFIADADNHRIRRVEAGTGIITTVAGTGTPGFSGDGGPATDAQLSVPYAVAIDAVGNLFIADQGNFRSRRVAAGIITTVAGTGIPGFSGDGGAATSAQLSVAYGVTTDGAGDLFIADTSNNRVRAVDLAVAVPSPVITSGPVNPTDTSATFYFVGAG